MKSITFRQKLLVLVSIVGLSFVVEALAQCPVGWSLTSNRTKLYLYYATASDATFPEYDPSVTTSPLEPFNVSDLDSGIGTTVQLRNRITDIVKEDYCEFDVEVVSTTTAPAPTETFWQVVGVGSDEEFFGGGELFGVAQAVDLNNADPQDFSRVYAKSFLNAYGPGEAEPALAGASSTLERWATAIGHTTSHEAGHNFGLSHNNSTAKPSEDETNNHIMATGSTGLTGEMRAGRNRHFSDTSYEILGHNIGLRYKTLTNWDFTNPNAEDAHQLVLTLLSPSPTLTLNWFYGGASSPWTNPTVAAAGTQTFQGTNYNKFTLTFSSPKAWSGGANGVVPGGVFFHTGATFSETDLVIVFETRVKDSGGNNLALHPRLMGFNAGAADLATGDFNIRAFNAGAPMILEDLQVQFLPRMASIESMINGAQLVDVRGVPVNAARAGDAFRPVKSLEVRDHADIRVATFKDRRTVDIFYDKSKCKPRPEANSPAGSPRATPTRTQGPGDTKNDEIDYCADGWALSLFPSTYVYLVATIIDPNAKYWDKAQAKYVTGPLRSKVFHQFVGTLPDFNHNGIDDLIDIRTNQAPDKNNNGIVDGAETTGQQPPEQGGATFYKWWWWLLLLLLFLLLIWWLFKRKRRLAT